MNEANYIAATLKDIRNQDNPPDYHIVIVVNQPESYYSDPVLSDICKNNLQTLNYLYSANIGDMSIIDKCSRNKAWDSKQYGVGIARKVAMDYALEMSSPDDVILCLDADTRISSSYLRSVAESFKAYPQAVGLSVPYYHHLTNDIINDRAILRYEIYMRNYALNMWRISNPYSFTAIGSGMACKASAYKAVGGISPRSSGEDFYFLMKLRKFGSLIVNNSEYVMPSARYSDRVFFGTGPALIKGVKGDWSSYPVYHYTLFNNVGESFKAINEIYQNPYTDYPMKNFLQNVFKEKDFVIPLIKNSKSNESFRKLFYQKVNALRILQYLKYENSINSKCDTQSLKDYLEAFHPHKTADFADILSSDDIFNSDTESLNSIRDYFFQKEREYQINTQILK